MTTPTPDHDEQRLRLTRALVALKELRAQLDEAKRERSEPIAIVGLGCRFPGGAVDPESFWRLLESGTDAIREVPPERWDVDAFYSADPEAAGKVCTRYGGFLDGIDRFDPHFFGIAPREAATLDPQQRLLLETAWEALEHAGLAPDQRRGSRTGVFVGISGNEYAQLLLSAGLDKIDSYMGSGNAHSVAAGRLSYLFGFEGPSVAIDTACSSSLVAIHLACQSLRLGESELALAGGVNLVLTPTVGVNHSRARMLAPDGRCKTFDASADGFVRSEGCGLVVLKRLSAALADGDPVLAVIRGSASNQDGHTSGLTVPNGPSQQAVIRAALDMAGLTPAEVSYVEAHGTGTALGDPIELHALAAVFGAGRSAGRPLAVGSVKTNIGHAEAAAGAAGVIKTVLALQHGTIPPHLHFQTPNPRVDWAETPVRVPGAALPWPRTEQPRVAGVSSFGFGGTNAHLVIAEAPVSPPRAAPASGRPRHLFTLSAASDEALKALAERYAAYLAQHPEASLADVCHTANTGRAHLARRLALVADSVAELREQLAAFATDAPVGAVSNRDQTPPVGMTSNRAPIRGTAHPARPPLVAFLFTGQGAQRPGMGRQLYETQPSFRADMDLCDRLLRPHLQRPLLDVLYPANPDDTALHETAYTQPALFALEYCLGRLWLAWGVKPDLLMGHSLGEYVAACLAGVFSLEDGLRLVAARARLMQEQSGEGAMAAVFADESEVRAVLARLAPAVSVAAVNGPKQVVVSGAPAGVATLLDHWAGQGVETQPLKVSRAFHSALVEPMLAEFERVAGTVAFSPPTLEVVSNLTGGLAGAELTDPAYWRNHARQPVRFLDGMRTLAAQGVGVFVEVGPHPVLLGMGRRCVDQPASAAWLPSLARGQDDWDALLATLAELHVRGVPVDWRGFDAGLDCRRLRLPTYPFQRQRYWAAPDWANHPAAPARRRDAGSVHPLLGERWHHARQPDEILFESELSAERPAFLGGHRVFGAAVMPASGYVEMALGAAGAAGFDPARTRLENLAFHRPLAFPEGESRLVQTSLLKNADGGHGLQIHSRAAADHAEGWTLHVSGTLSVETTAACRSGFSPTPATRRSGFSPTPPPYPVECRAEARPTELATLRERLAEAVPVATLYEGYARHDVEFGPTLGAVRELWRGDGEALGRVVLPEGAARDGEYRLHPVWLDACAQVLGAAATEADITYLQARIGRVRVHGQPGASAWAYARVRPETGDGTRRADLLLLDDGGAVLAEMDDLEARPVDAAWLRTGGATAGRLGLYEPRWLPSPRAEDCAGFLPEPKAIAAALEPHLQTGLADARLRDYGAALARLDALVPDYIADAFRQLGWPYRPGQRFATDEARAALGVVPGQARLVGRLLEILAEAGILRRVGAVWEVAADLPTETAARRAAVAEACGAAQVELEVLDRCGSRLGDALRGRCDPLQLLFPEGDRGSAATIYQASPGAAAMNGLLRHAVAELRESLPAGRPLRVLEVGAGTGGATAWVLPELPPDTEYVFTDISRGFFAEARARFAAYPFVRYETLDIERAPDEQGFAGQAFDVVIAFNVLHATRSLAETTAHVHGLLAPGGLLLLLENTEPAPWVDLIWGLTPGWWRFDDPATRPDYPLLSADRWREFLSAQGFGEVATIAADPRRHGILARQALIVGRKTGPAVAANPRPWLILGDAGGVGGALAERLTASGQRVIRATPGTAFTRTGEDAYALDPLGTDDFRQLLAALAGTPPQAILHLWGLDAAARTDWTAEALLAESVRLSGGAARLVEALAATDSTSALWLVTRGAQAVGGESGPPALGQATLWGMGKVMARECPDLWGGLIDLSPTPGPGEAARLLDELRFPDGEDFIALRGAERHVLRLSPVAPIPPHDPPVRADGVYLITGGLGGLGLEIARWLAGQGARRLALVGRSGAATDAARQALAELEQRGATVTVHQADVADGAAMARVFADAQASGAPLRGIVHAAGLPGRAALATLDPADLERMFAAKVAGAWHLHRLSLDARLDFFLCCSSMVSLWGAKEQGHYVAANHFLDALAHYRRALGLPALCVNWGPLEGGGMLPPEDVPELRRIGVNAIPMAQAVRVLADLLGSDVVQAAPVDIDWPLFRGLYQSRGTCRLFDLLVSDAPASAAPAGESSVLDRLRTAPESDRREILAAHVQTVLGQVLGLSPSRPADRRQGFFDMGMDSLTAMELRAKLQAGLAVSLPSTLAFDFGTVEALTDYVLGLLGERFPTATATNQTDADVEAWSRGGKPLPPSGETTEAMLDGLSDADVEALLEAKLLSL